MHLQQTTIHPPWTPSKTSLTRRRTRRPGPLGTHAHTLDPTLPQSASSPPPVLSLSLRQEVQCSPRHCPLSRQSTPLRRCTLTTSRRRSWPWPPRPHQRAGFSKNRVHCHHFSLQTHAHLLSCPQWLESLCDVCGILTIRETDVFHLHFEWRQLERFPSTSQVTTIRRVPTGHILPQGPSTGDEHPAHSYRPHPPARAIQRRRTSGAFDTTGTMCASCATSATCATFTFGKADAKSPMASMRDELCLFLPNGKVLNVHFQQTKTSRAPRSSRAHSAEPFLARPFLTGKSCLLRVKSPQTGQSCQLRWC